VRALNLFAVLVLAKLLVHGGWSAAAFLWQDAALALVFAMTDWIVRRPVLGWIAYGAVALYTALNVAVVNVLSTPLTFHMLKAADPAMSDSIEHHMTAGNLLPSAFVLLAAAALPTLIRHRGQDSGGRRFGLAATVAGLVLVGVGPWITGRVTADRSCNAVIALLASTLPRLEAASDSGARDWRRTGAPVADPRLTELRSAGRGRNVVLVILESAGAQYLKPYGAVEDPMPNLTRLAEKSVVFKNAYAVYPESIKGLVALQYSLHPAMDTTPGQYRRPPAPALGEVLGRAGYDTALFHSGRFEYLGMDDVIANAGYAARIDAGDISGNRESSFGVDEESTVGRALQWVDRDRTGPFFLTYMPVAGHHPYDSPDGGPFDSGELIGAYRNALHSADRALGQLITGLRDRGVWNDTVFVVVGDHGQAFGQHEDNFGHTFFLFEENVHVPFVIAVPGSTLRTIAVESVVSHVDVAPTILDLLALGIPDEYEGASALQNRRSLSLLFTDYAHAFIGLRDGSFKFIHHVESGRSWLFDLGSDPSESSDLSAANTTRVSDYREHLLSWAAARRGAVRRW
jgi:glucan phosphoethanolaminetransferase (alkaline phosphatase superfamily)